MLLSISVVVLLVLLSGGLAAYLNRWGLSRPVWVLGFTAFGARVLFVSVDSFLRLFAGQDDASGYDASFWFVAELWRSGAVLAPLRAGASPGNDGYYMALYSAVFSPVYVLFGHNPILPRLLMALFGALVVVNVYLIASELADHCAGLYAGGLAAFFPYWIMLSSIVYRDMFTVFLFSLAAYYLVRWQSGDRTLRTLVLTLVVGAAAVQMRHENAAIVALTIAVALVTLTDRTAKQYAVAFLTAMIAGVAVVVGFGELLPIDALANQRLWLARPNDGAYFTGFAYESGVELVLFAPIGALYFVLAPFPWQAVDPLALVAIGQNLFLWYPAVVLAMLGVRDIFRELEVGAVLPLVVFVLAGITVYGLVEGNIGPAMRHRSQFQFVVFVFTGIAASRRLQPIFPETFGAVFGSPSSTEVDD